MRDLRNEHTGATVSAATNDPNTQGALIFEFWCEFASTYSYLSAARIAQEADRRRISVRWRPFLLGPIFQAQGWNDSPLYLYPAKGRYMWRDLERRCARYGLAFQKPTQFPRNGLRAARFACALLDHAETALHVPEFVAGVYAANFAHDRNIAEESVLVEVMSDLGLDSETCNTIVSSSTGDAMKLKLRAATDCATALGIFGAPTFAIRRTSISECSPDPAQSAEIFWGDDRLEDAFEFFSAQSSAMKHSSA